MPQTDRQLVIQTLKDLTKRRIAAQTAKKLLVLQKRVINQDYEQRIGRAQRRVAETTLRIQRELTTYRELLGVKMPDDE